MKIGTVKELKVQEYRVGMTPDCVRSYINHGHTVFVEMGAGLGSGFSDEDYIRAGARLCENGAYIYQNCDMVVKVKEPLEQEYQNFRKDLILFTFLHLAANLELTKAMLESQIKGIAFETIEDDMGNLPCLRPMSEIAGRLSIQEGAKYLEKHSGGRGILLSGVPGVARGKVVIIGGGIAGMSACKIAYGMGAEVTVLDLNLNRLAILDETYQGKITTLYNSEENLINSIKEADCVVCAVLLPGACAPKLIRRNHLKLMKEGSVIVDISIDQGGCCETSKLTFHDNPVYRIDGVLHYCVGNMPGAVPRTSTLALCNTILPYGLKIADLGIEEACRRDKGFAKGVNTYAGACTCQTVAGSLMIDFIEIDRFIE